MDEVSKMSKVFIVGNGESRKKVDLMQLNMMGKVYGCNALYRDYTPDVLIVVDGGMQHEVYTSGYPLKNKCYFRSWTRLPGIMFDTIVGSTEFEHEGWTIFNKREDKNSFVFNGTDPNQMKRQHDHYTSMGYDQKTIDELLSKHHRWITWCEEYGDDEVYLISEEYSGWSAGPIAVRTAISNENPTDIFLIGFDMGSSDGKVNNMYKDTDNYLSSDAAVTPDTNWIQQHKQNFLDYPHVRFWKVNPAPLGTDDTCKFIEEWKDIENLQYIELKNLNLSVDFGWMM